MARRRSRLLCGLRNVSCAVVCGYPELVQEEKRRRRKGGTCVLLKVVGAEHEDLVVETLHREPFACCVNG